MLIPADETLVNLKHSSAFDFHLTTRRFHVKMRRQAILIRVHLIDYREQPNTGILIADLSINPQVCP